MDDMNRKEFLNELEDIMELDPNTLTENQVLLDLRQWDSIAFLSIIAMLDEKFGIIIQGAQLENITKVTDIIALVEGHLD